MNDVILTNAQKCEQTLAGYLDNDHCIVDKDVFQGHLTCEQLDGNLFKKQMKATESIVKIGAIGPSGIHEWDLCRFPLSSINKIDKTQESWMHFGLGEARAYQRDRWNKANDKKKQRLMDGMRLRRELEIIAQGIVTDGSQHQPTVFIEKSDHKLDISQFMFDSDAAKEVALKKLKEEVLKAKSTRYWLIMEAWVGKKLWVRPKYDVDRTEALIITEYDKDDTHSIATVLPFARKDKQIIWQMRRENLGGGERGSDRWNAWMEDTLKEKTIKLKKQQIEKEIAEMKIKFKNELLKEGKLTPDEEKALDMGAESAKKKFFKLIDEGKI